MRILLRNVQINNRENYEKIIPTENGWTSNTTICSSAKLSNGTTVTLKTKHDIMMPKLYICEG